MSDQQSLVTIEDGQLQGSIKIDWLGGKYCSFQGIPYAKPPVGELRFKAPQPVDPWTGIKDATKEGSGCYSRHYMHKIMTGSEDCLFLNVYTSWLLRDNQQLRPVMVWLHGGAFKNSSGSTELYSPEFLVSEDIVLVTFNYRVGLLGFACFADPLLEVPGNAGLKDQVHALKWVQKNILKFGGDPNNVTIFGESSGGASVHLLMLSPLTKGLFHRAISQSGVSTGGWAKGQLTAPLVAAVLGLKNVNEKELLKILNEYPVEELLRIQEKFPEVNSLSQKRTFGPVIESPNDKSSFLTCDPQEILSLGSYCHVPLMIGYTSREGMLFELTDKAKYGKIKWLSDYEDVIPFCFQLTKGTECSRNVADRMKEFYYGNEIASLENIDSYYLIYTDTYFFLDINNAVRDHTKTSSCATYYYRMSLDTPFNMFKKIGKIKNPGASHGDDIGYLFKNTPISKIRPQSREDIGIRRFIKLWATFAKYGDPNPVKKDDLINVTWPQTENNKLHYLDIGENLTIGINPEAERVAFWDEIFDLCSLKTNS